jgi:hypothetical protein
VCVCVCVYVCMGRGRSPLVALRIHDVTCLTRSFACASSSGDRGSNRSGVVNEWSALLLLLVLVVVLGWSAFSPCALATAARAHEINMC